MNREALTTELLEKVLAIYFAKAYPDRSRATPVFHLSPQASSQEILSIFVEESTVIEDQVAHRFIMRLGNVNYPFMKLAFQEHLFKGEFFFSVDTHDDIEVPANAPDYEAWVALKDMNRRLKREIEDVWEKEGIPTQRLLQKWARGQTGSVESELGRSILVVDDEEELAEAVVALLRAKGYRSWAVFDGKQALQEVRKNPPDLLIMDYEMPNLSGVEVIDLLQKEEKTAQTPVLLVTGGPINLSEKAKATGFLCKPFSEDLMLNVVRHLLREG